MDDKMVAGALAALWIMGETATLPIDRVMGYKIYKWEFEFESHFLVHEQ